MINLVNNFKVKKVIFNCGEFNDLEKELIKVLEVSYLKNTNIRKNLKELIKKSGILNDEFFIKFAHCKNNTNKNRN